MVSYSEHERRAALKVQAVSILGAGVTVHMTDAMYKSKSVMNAVGFEKVFLNSNRLRAAIMFIAGCRNTPLCLCATPC